MEIKEIQEVKMGSDFSRWNPVKNYDTLRESGMEFAIVKVNNAGNVPDTRFYEHMKGFRDAGIRVIAGYNYSYANTEDKAKRASDSFVNIGAPEGINTMALDLEDAVMKYLGRRILKIIRIYEDTAKQAGMDFIIYTGASFFEPYLKPYISELSDISWWWARYPSTKDRLITDPVPDSKYLPKGLDIDGWQYSSKLKINGASGYLDLNVWYESSPFSNKQEMIPIEYNPFREPAQNVKLGTKGNDANWVLWYLWRFGKLLDAHGNPEASQINGIITVSDSTMIKEVQRMLGLVPDGIVGKTSKAVWKKIC